MKRLALAFCLLVGLARVASAQTPTPASFFPVPQQNASFFTTLYNFLIGGEDAARDATWQGDFKIEVAGCKHPTAAGMTGTFAQTCYAFVDGDYIIDPAASIDYAAMGATANDWCWVILTPQVNTTEAGFTRLAGTHYMANCTAASSARPTLAGPGMYVMGVTISGSAITAVVDETALAPTIWTYTNTSEIAARTDRIWRGPVDGSSSQTYCFSDDLGQCDVIAFADASGCALCGDTATGFFAAGQIEPARGGTGDNTSATTGVPYVTAGNWQYEAALDESRGGTGADNSAATGVQRYTAGTASVQPFPDFRTVSPAMEWGVDGTQCTKDDTNQFANTNVPVAAALCADNAAGRLAGTFWLPAAYDPNTEMVFTLAAVNNSTNAGVLGFDFTCLCAGNLDTIDAANFPSAVNLDLSFDGTQSELISTVLGSASITCGGTCAVGDLVVWRAAVDNTATTITTPTDVKLLTLQLEADQTALSQ